MKYKVAYFSKTGTSKSVAEEIGKKLSCEVVQITDNMNWKGIFGFIKGGYYSVKNKEVEIKIQGNIEGADALIVVTAVWAGKITPTIRTFLKTVGSKEIHLVATSGNSLIKEREGFKSVTDITMHTKDKAVVIDTLINSLKA